MSTTTIRLPEALKTRIAKAARRSNQSTHSFILEAISEKAEQEERRIAFHDLAEHRYASIVASGKTIPWTEMRNYLQDRIDGKSAGRPRARKLAR
jgi:hypothetical protein